MRRAEIAVGTAGLLALIAGLLVPCAAQSKPAPQSSRNQIRVVTNEITVPVTMTDKSGEFVLDLEQQDFHVYDDGVPQTIDHWELGGDPLAIALVIETSTRLRAYIPTIHHLGPIFTQTVMALDGEAAVITYGSNVYVDQPFTTDHDAVEKAIADTKFEVPEMSLYDGMARAVQLLSAQPAKWRRVMLIIGESEDDASRAKLQNVLRNAERADTSIYVVGPSSTSADVRRLSDTPIPLKLPHLPPITGDEPCVQRLPGGSEVPCISFARPALWLLERGTNQIKHHELVLAAAATGGIDYRAMRESTLQDALDRIGGELHAQYVLTYRPNAPRSVGFHAISVGVSRPKLTVRARPVYYFDPQQN